MKSIYPLLCLLTIPFWSMSQAVITAVFDADLPGGLPKGVELYLLEDIGDLSRLGLGIANNGGGTDGVELTFPVMAADSGSYLYVASDSASFNTFFGFDADLTTGAISINGDDAIELFWDSLVIDVFGEIDINGTGQPWEYQDSWAARKAFSGPDGQVFVLQNWFFGGVGALDGETTNGAAQNPVPLKRYTDTTAAGPDVIVVLQNLQFVPADVTIEPGQTVRWINHEFDAHNVNGLQALFPCNPAGFSSGNAAVGPWQFDFTFTEIGTYDYQCDPHVAFGMVGTVTVVDPDAPDYPLYDIAMVHTEDLEGKADSLGVTAELKGVVHGPNFMPGGLQFTIIDVAGGTGIQVSGTGSDCYQVVEGEMVSVKGSIAQIDGQTAIVPEAGIEVLSTGNPLMVPVPVDPQSPLTEEMESTMVLVEDLRVDSILSSGADGWKLFASNPSSVTYLVRLDADVIPDASIYEGQVIDVTGIVVQFDDSAPFDEGYQLQPRGPHDIEIQVSLVTLPESTITMCPNPASDRIGLRTAETIRKITVLTTSGRTVLFLHEEQSSVKISGIPAGEYLMVVETSNGIWSSPFIKL